VNNCTKRWTRFPRTSSHERTFVIEPVVEDPATETDAGDIIDDWGNLSAMKRASAGRTMGRMAQEEADAGLEPW
jgi:hypothetical protein